MTMFTSMTALQAAGFYVALLIVLMIGLKIYVGGQRGKLKVAPGDVSNPDFARAGRVQMNAVEDVPPLMVGLLALGLLDAALWWIHVSGAALVLSRILHAQGLASSGGFSFGRMVGTIGTLLVSIVIVAGLFVAIFA
ncbi:glutathione S-transferase [bacterium]|nr:glutathione S-transferase [bacterium]